MGCDWSKSASSFEDLQDAPYALLSVSVEEAAYKAGKRSGGTKKRDKKKSRDASGNVEVPKPSSQIAEDGVHRSGLPSLGANRRRDETDVPNKENAPGLGGLGFGGKLGLGLKLDLTKALNQGREPTERQLRKEKLDRYENECTQIEDYMYVGGMIVAKNKELLKRVGITHIINCSAITTENFFPDSFTYKAIYMNDSPGEDIACHIYSVAAVIDEVRRKGQKVLVHCTQGVSRSCSFCIAYLMLKEKMSYDDGFQRLKTRRGICNPNPGFCSQLVRWGRRIQAASSTTALSYQPRLFRLDYYYPANDKAGVAPMLVERKGDKPVPKYVLITAAVYIVDTPECLFVWIGTGARGEHTTAADFAVESLQKYEGSPMVVERCAEGEESQHMLDVLHELRCELPREATPECAAMTPVDRTAEAVAQLADDSAYLAEKAQRRAEERERAQREEDRRRVEEEQRLIREQEAREVREQQERQDAEAERAASESSQQEPAARKPMAFPQGGGPPQEVETPRGKRSDAAQLAGLSGLKLPGVGGGTGGSGGEGARVSPVKEAASDSSGENDSDELEFKMRLFEIQESETWEELKNFDSDDLWSNKAFVLVEKSEDAVPVYVWIGAEFEGVRDPEDEDECHQFSLAAVKRFSKAEKITVEEVKVVIEGNEPDAFWDMFELG